MATGLLILGVGNSTRLLTYFVGLDKVYEATIRLGVATTTDDAEGEPLSSAADGVIAKVTNEGIVAGVAALTGHIQQVPSTVSAIKIGGKRAYARVRAGDDVVLAARAVTVASFEVIEVRRLGADTDRAAIDVDVRVACSSGTYVRALARDLGAALGVGGHLTSLRRTRIGPFRVEDACIVDNVGGASALIDPAAAASRLFRRLDLTEQQAVDLGHGKRIRCEEPPLSGSSAHFSYSARRDVARPVGEYLAAIDPGGRLVGLVAWRGTEATVVVNFPHD